MLYCQFVVIVPWFSLVSLCTWQLSPVFWHLGAERFAWEKKKKKEHCEFSLPGLHTLLMSNQAWYFVGIQSKKGNEGVRERWAGADRRRSFLFHLSLTLLSKSFGWLACCVAPFLASFTFHLSHLLSHSALCRSPPAWGKWCDVCKPARIGLGSLGLRF